MGERIQNMSVVPPRLGAFGVSNGPIRPYGEHRKIPHKMGGPSVTGLFRAVMIVAIADRILPHGGRAFVTREDAAYVVFVFDRAEELVSTSGPFATWQEAADSMRAHGRRP
jgi:hypothetical protein